MLFPFANRRQINLYKYRTVLYNAVYIRKLDKYITLARNDKLAEICCFPSPYILLSQYQIIVFHNFTSWGVATMSTIYVTVILCSLYKIAIFMCHTHNVTLKRKGLNVVKHVLLSDVKINKYFLQITYEYLLYTNKIRHRINLKGPLWDCNE